MGFDTEEIADYYASAGRADDLLARLEKKLSALQESVDEMRLRTHDVPDMSVSLIKVPEMTCCVRRFQGASVQNKYNAIYAFFHECVKRGTALAAEPLFIINERTDYLDGRISPEPFDPPCLYSRPAGTGAGGCNSDSCLHCSFPAVLWRFEKYKRCPFVSGQAGSGTWTETGRVRPGHQSGRPLCGERD